MLASASVGAIWSSCSPDFGEKGIWDRLGQIEPKLIFYTPFYKYNGRSFASWKHLENIAKNNEIDLVSVAICSSDAEDEIEADRFSDILENHKTDTIDYAECSFNDPLYIMFSSGTTGVPKCIVHRIGGVLLEHKKELSLHCDMKRREIILPHNLWLDDVELDGITIAVGSKLMVYDGSPFFQKCHLWEKVSESDVSFMGESKIFNSLYERWSRSFFI